MILPADSLEVSAEPLFEPGQLVRHRRYGYRGVVVDLDRTCQADEDWYRQLRTQPRRSQPWYHVLVHQRGHSTYAAQQNLTADDSAEPIEHASVPRYFAEFVDGRYIRNDEPWRG